MKIVIFEPPPDNFAHIFSGTAIPSQECRKQTSLLIRLLRFGFLLIGIHLILHLFALIGFSVKSKIIFMFLLCCNLFINFE